jgi:hypothetical protein
VGSELNPPICTLHYAVALWEPASPLLSAPIALQFSGNDGNEAEKLGENNEQRVFRWRQHCQTYESPPMVSRHSHSILSMHRNALIYQRKFFLPMLGIRTTTRQNFLLMISKENLADSAFARFRGLSTTIGRFPKFFSAATSSSRHKKYRQRAIGSMEFGTIQAEIAYRGAGIDPPKRTIASQRRDDTLESVRGDERSLRRHAGCWKNRVPGHTGAVGHHGVLG